MEQPVPAAQTTRYVTINFNLPKQQHKLLVGRPIVKANNNFPQNNQQQQEQFYQQQRLYNPQQQRKSGNQQFLGQNQYSQFTPNQQQYPQLTQQQLRAQHQQQQNVRSQHQQTFVQQPNWLHNQNYGNNI